MGTMLQNKRLISDYPPEILNIDKPDEIETIHREYIDAGADFITTNSFGGNRIKLSSHGLSDKVREVNALAMKIALKATNQEKGIAASIGPTGQLIEPMGYLTFENALNCFKEQITILIDNGADLIIFETFTDIHELKAAVMAAKSLSVDFIANISIDSHLKTALGTSLECFAETIKVFSPLAFGLNCGKNPDDYKGAVSFLREKGFFPLLAEPNAGIPSFLAGKTVFPSDKKSFSDLAIELAVSGASIIGGCCGTTPDHIRLISLELKDVKKPTPIEPEKKFSACSRTKKINKKWNKERTFFNR
jgi:5-methyltetrahydrofolate--homocysteine methyltransferase